MSGKRELQPAEGRAPRGAGTPARERADAGPAGARSSAVAASQNGEAKGVKSALRVLQILEHFGSTLRPATLAELSKQLEMPKSSCLALLETLRQSGYLYWMGKDNGYYPTRRWADLGETISRHDHILFVCRPILQEIRDAVLETVMLAKREGERVLYLDVLEEIHPLQYSARVGQYKPIHSGASGRALLALLPPPERQALIAQIERRRFAEATLVDPNEISEAVDKGIETGWHVAVGEFQADITSVAAGFRFGAGDYALVVGAPTARILKRVDQIGRLLAEQAKKLAAM